MTWFVLGFTTDEVVGAGQDWRLAEQCVHAWEAAGRPPGFSVLQSGGDADHLIHWFMNPVAAQTLDAQSVPWRNRIIAECEAPPAMARSAVRTEAT